MKYSSTQVMKKFLTEDSPVKPGSKLIVKGTGDAPSTELLAVKKSLDEGNIDYAAACLGLSKIDNKTTPYTDEVAIPAAA